MLYLPNVLPQIILPFSMYHDHWGDAVVLRYHARYDIVRN